MSGDRTDSLILAIETSLDDTCAAVVDGTKVLSSVVASQVQFHAEFGGTKPDVARRKHVEYIDFTIQEAMNKARVNESAFQAVGVTFGPGLAPALEVGIAEAKRLAYLWNKPLVAVNHMEGHLLSPLLSNSKGHGGLSLEYVQFPVLGLLISGGHTMLVKMEAFGNYQLLGETLDDAVGEAYDKVARMLDLGYPGGPILAELAVTGEAVYDLPEPMVSRQDLNFSLSGLKTAAKYLIEKLEKPLSAEITRNVAASFEHAVIRMITRRLDRAIGLVEPAMIWLGGGVAANLSIRAACREVGRRYDLPIKIPYRKQWCTDNAAMIGLVAGMKYARGEIVSDLSKLDREPNLSFGRE